MSKDTAPERIWLQWPHGWEKYGTIERSLVIWDFQRVWNGDVEYIRADVCTERENAIQSEVYVERMRADSLRNQLDAANARIAELEAALRLATKWLDESCNTFSVYATDEGVAAMRQITKALPPPPVTDVTP